MSVNSDRKGKVGEREAAKELARLFNVEARRGQQHRGGPDSPDVAGLPGCHVEVKRVEKLRLWEAVAQAAAEAGEGEVPVVLHRANNRPWLAIVELERLPELAVKLFHTLAASD